MSTKPRNPDRPGAHGNQKRRSTLPRISSIEGILARVELRDKLYAALPAALKDGFHKPGSHNPHKVGR